MSQDICFNVKTAYIFEMLKGHNGEIVPEDEHRAVRVYSNSPETIALQIRASNQLHDGKMGQRRMVAVASLNADECKQLHDALTKVMRDRRMPMAG